ncbi:hypothetical protein BD770DRAFT_456878 [Pilaira anomala]|nr:hypothetical protein BD770DRAFT_456878 [Pilaira anomala]
MNNLPAEVLLNVFFQLTQFDLRQCQLTSKKWYMTATKTLYSKVETINDNQCRDFVNRLRASPKLGRYLKCLDAKDQFNGHHRYLIRLGKYRLLTAVSNYCPNITNIIAEIPDCAFWSQLHDEIIQGRMKNIQYLPEPFYHNSSTFYVRTSLLLRKSLKRLTVFDSGGLINQSDVYQKAHQPFIKDFLKLEELNIHSGIYQKITHLNTIIQDFRHLKSLSIYNLDNYLFSRSSVQEEPVISNILSCDIRGLECNWQLINSDNQLMYVMQMFPNLYHLKILCERLPIQSPSISAGVQVQFLHYISKIPKVNIQSITQADTSVDSLNLWEVIEEADM